MRQEAVIRLTIEERRDHSLYVSSPDVPFLHVVVPDRASLHAMVLPIVKELLKRNRQISADLRMVEVLEPECADVGTLPAPHIIAQVSM